MKILITGSNGYIARNLSNKLCHHNLTFINRSNLDLMDSLSVKKYFASNIFDIIIHTAVVGGSRLKEDNFEQFYSNCLMHQNILENSHSYNKYISFGSGAELDRSKDVDYSSSIFTSFPIDPYGMSKNFIAKSGFYHQKFYNLRIFNVFNEDESSTRMIKSNILNYINNKPIIIHQNKMMDFFHMDDLVKVINYYIENDNPPKQINCVYQEKYSLVDIANMINNLDDHKVEIKILNDEMANTYIGTADVQLLKIKICDLENGIKKTYEMLKTHIV